MSIKFYCQLDIKASHKRSNIYFSYENHVRIFSEVHFCNRRLFGLNIHELRLTPNDVKHSSRDSFTRRVTMRCEIENVPDCDDVIKFAKKIESYLTSLLVKFEVNPQSGVLCRD